MTEPPNSLDVIGPLLPFEVTPGVFLVSRGVKRINIDWAMRKADIDALNAIASILNAAPAQAAAYERLRADNAKLREALEWYEKQAAGCREITSARFARNALDRDGGARAARVLAETEPK